MSIKYKLWPTDKRFPIGNIEDKCISCARTCSVEREVIECKITGEKHRRGLIDLSIGKLYLCTDEAVKSNRIFNEKIRILSEILPLVNQTREGVIDSVTNEAHRLFHNLITLNAQTIQAIYRVVPQDDFRQKDRESLFNAVSKRLLASTEQTTSLVVDVLKNANLEKIEFSVYTKLFEGEPIDCQPCSVHKIFMLTLNTYWDALKEKEVYIHIGECRENVYVDYEMIAASFVHLLDNITKYVLPKSSIRFSFEETPEVIVLLMDMVSLRISDDEIDKIFDEGFSGEEAKKIHRQGEGRGLYLVKRLLELNNSVLEIDNDVDKTRQTTRLGVNFQNNIFRLSMPRS